MKSGTKFKKTLLFLSSSRRKTPGEDCLSAASSTAPDGIQLRLPFDDLL